MTRQNSSHNLTLDELLRTVRYMTDVKHDPEGNPMQPYEDLMHQQACRTCQTWLRMLDTMLGNELDQFIESQGKPDHQIDEPTDEPQTEIGLIDTPDDSLDEDYEYEDDDYIDPPSEAEPPDYEP